MRKTHLRNYFYKRIDQLEEVFKDIQKYPPEFRQLTIIKTKTRIKELKFCLSVLDKHEDMMKVFETLRRDVRDNVRIKSPLRRDVPESGDFGTEKEE